MRDDAVRTTTKPTIAPHPTTPPRAVKRKHVPTRPERRNARARRVDLCTALDGGPALAPLGDHVVTCQHAFGAGGWRPHFTVTSAADRSAFAQLAPMPLPNAVREIARRAFDDANPRRVYVAVGEPRRLRVGAGSDAYAVRGWVPHARRIYLQELEAYGGGVPTLHAALREPRHGDVKDELRDAILFVGCDEARLGPR